MVTAVCSSDMVGVCDPQVRESCGSEGEWVPVQILSAAMGAGCGVGYPPCPLSATPLRPALHPQSELQGPGTQPLHPRQLTRREARRGVATSGSACPNLGPFGLSALWGMGEEQADQGTNGWKGRRLRELPVSSPR